MATKYLTERAVSTAISHLRKAVHPFMGITFLACKKAELPVGDTARISIDKLTNDHLRRYHRLDPKSDYYFQPFKSPSKWVTSRYASTGLQTVNTQTFSDVFLHERQSKDWGFKSNYVNKIRENLDRQTFNSKIPVVLLAIWIYKEEPLEKSQSLIDLIEKFKRSFHITIQESESLFIDRSDLISLNDSEIFSIEPYTPSRLLRIISPPPDSSSGKGKTLKSLKLRDTDIAGNLQIDFGERLSVITGDNGLGKSFLLEFAWKSATGSWANKPILPTTQGGGARPGFSFEIVTSDQTSLEAGYFFDSKLYEWKRQRTKSSDDGRQLDAIEALCIFSRADGSFALYDPFMYFSPKAPDNESTSLELSEVWNGKEGILEGLIRDWVRWQLDPDQSTFDKFASVLRTLSPEDLGELRPGPAIRLPNEPRDIPTICHDYGTVPIIHASAGVQRILVLTYLLILSWKEHELRAERQEREPLRRMLLLVDELEAHLHPKWQRMVLPSLMGAAELLSGKITVQIIVATHSPMILASIEPEFTQEKDSLYHLFVRDGKVGLAQLPFVKHGDASGWLTSPVFGLKHARSKEAEKAIEKAKALQLAESVDNVAIEDVTIELKRLLPNDDSFWPRWLFFAESNGVKI